MKALHKDSLKEIKNTYKRFISILVIVLLGVGFFAGIKATSPDMKKTVDSYFDEKQVMDFEVLSTMGLVEKDIDAIEELEEVEKAEGSYSKDVIVKVDQKEIVVKIHSILAELNQLELKEGELPKTEAECVVEANFLKDTGKKIGDIIQIEEEDEFFKTKEFKIVGVVQSPLYISRERGSTKLGSGQISSYLYVPKKAISSKVYTEAYIKMKGGTELLCYEDEYKDKVEEVAKKLETVGEKRKKQRYQEIKQEAEESLQEGQEEFDTKKIEAENQIKEAEDKIVQGEAKLKTVEQQLIDGESQVKSNKTKVEKEWRNAEKALNDAEAKIQEKETEISKGKEELIIKEAEAQAAIGQIDTGIAAMESNVVSLEEQKKKLEEMGQDVSQIQMQIDQLKETINQSKAKKQEISSQIEGAKQKIEKGEEAIVIAKQDLGTQKANLEKGKKQAQSEINAVEKKLQEGREEVKKSQEKLQKGKEELEVQKVEAEKQLQEAQNKLDEAKKQIEELEKPEWYVLDRETNVGYVSYIQDTDRIANIGKVFPVVFFIVAALISLTSMTRMVEEQRTEIGTLKALGYQKGQIASKYILYAFLGTIIGGIIGMTIGFQILPKLIFDIYSMMYELPKIHLEFNWNYAIVGMGIAFLCTVGSTIYSCIAELRSTPATLMRPKAPKMGKKVLLEKIPFIWKRLKFTQKVTVRNIFRYKKRVLMTIIGILGCTALMVAGFGLRDSVSKMIPTQYGEVFLYDLSLSFKEDVSEEDVNQEIEQLNSMTEIENILKVNMQAVEITDRENNQEIQLIIPEKVEEFDQYVDLENRTSKETYQLNQDGIVITEKLAKLLEIKKGDSITIQNSDEKQAKVQVIGITKNYLMHYIYMSPEYYQKIFDEDIQYHSIFAKTISLSDDEEENLGKNILKNESISDVTFTSATESLFNDVMDNMTLVVWILIISAGLLAFVVLYNLSNVNISERIRELATIKVLGFYDKEVYKYIARETTILTFIGILLGLLAGYFLNMFIIKTCELDILMFDTRMHFTSYLYAGILTIIFTMIVNIVTYFALKKIDMIESLKSVE
ncbi:MAG TPA: ABC transporter permease [Candidatus Merdicola faecigallinarum]|uniref:ABC transporter permease n=1 Tax=Candidatus Merdicola faecigallinarum TaxID=2840862 RepID=A0A9D1M0H9_9FIRM|nr:ABC transporter permease [Candidatus Merdicola faecigallinarum]